MKKYLILLFLFSSVSIWAQTSNQPGYVSSISYTFGKEGDPIEGVRIKVLTEVRSNSRGEFVVPVTDSKNGLFTFSQIHKDGYELISPSPDKLQNEQFAINSGAKVRLVMASKTELYNEKRRIESNMRSVYEGEISDLNDRIDKLVQEKDSLSKKTADISVMENQLQTLLAERDALIDQYDKSDEYIASEARRLSRIDYQSCNSEEEARILELKKSGKGLEVAKAAKEQLSSSVMAKLKSDPSFFKRNYEESRREAEMDLNIFNDSRRHVHDIFEGFQMAFRHDSAAFYLKIYTDMDSSDYYGALEYAKYVSDNLDEYSEALEYLSPVLKDSADNSFLAIASNIAGSIYQETSRYEQAERMYRGALAIYDSLSDKLSESEVMFNLGTLYSALDDYPSAIECFIDSNRLAEEADAGVENVSNGHCGLAGVYIQSGRFEEARQSLDKAFSHFSELMDDPSYSVICSVLLGTKANYFSALGQLDSAEACNRKAMEYVVRYYGENHSKVATLLVNIGGIYTKMGRFDDADEVLTKASEMCDRIYGKYNQQSYIPRLRIAQNLESTMKYKEAAALYADMIETFSSSYKANHLLAILYSDYASCLVSLKEFDKALEYYLESLETDKMFFGENSKELATTYSNIGLVYHYKKDYESAANQFIKAVETVKGIYGPDNINLVTSMLNLSGSYRSMGKLDQCLSVLTDAEAIVNSNTSRPRLTSNVYSMLAKVKNDMGEYEDAFDYAAKSLEVLQQIGDKDAIIGAIGDLATIQESRHLFEEAIQERLRAVELCNEMGEHHLVDAAYYLYRLSADSFSINRIESSLDYAQRAYDIYKALYGEDDPGVAASKQLIDYCGMIRLPHLVLAKISENGLAAKAGLSGTLIVLKVNDEDILNCNNLLSCAAGYPFGTKVSLLFMDTDLNFYDLVVEDSLIGAQFSMIKASDAMFEQISGAYKEHVGIK